jgi:hypothetical protein
VVLALVNAVPDALKPVNVGKLEMPFTSHRLWRAIHQHASS